MQIIAMITMLIDHIGIVFFPNDLTWRIVGRIAFPIYAYLIVRGYFYTSNQKKYIIRLLLIGIISQLPFMFALQQPSINVVGTFVICLIILNLLDRLKQTYLNLFITLIALFFLEMIPFDYGSYALILILIFRYSKRPILHHFLLNLFYTVYAGWLLSIFSIVSTLLIYKGKNMLKTIEKIKINRIIWRSFYPAHLVILFILKGTLLLDFK